MYLARVISTKNKILNNMNHTPTERAGNM